MEHRFFFFLSSGLIAELDNLINRLHCHFQAAGTKFFGSFLGLTMTEMRALVILSCTS